MARELSEVGVVGLGTMGAGITEVLARAGLSVTAVEISDEALARGRGHIEHSTERAMARGKLDQAERDAIFERIRFATSLEDLASAELVIEAVPERMELKTDVFSQLDKICPPDTILATNTSSLSVTELSVATGRPSKVIGMHFFNPAPVMKLVEVVRGAATSSTRPTGPSSAASWTRPSATPSSDAFASARRSRTWRTPSWSSRQCPSAWSSRPTSSRSWTRSAHPTPSSRPTPPACR